MGGELFAEKGSAYKACFQLIFIYLQQMQKLFQCPTGVCQLFGKGQQGTCLGIDAGTPVGGIKFLPNILQNRGSQCFIMGGVLCIP